MNPFAARIAILISTTLVSVNAIAQDPTPGPQFRPSSPDLERRDQPVSSDDVEILLKAMGMLEHSSQWNRQDDRICDDDEATGVRSLFCALRKASIDVLGAYDHRRVALQEVRFAIMDSTNVLDFEHRLRDYNNLPETELSDVRYVLNMALDRVRTRLDLKD